MIYIDDKFYKDNKEICDKYLNYTVGDILIFNTMFFEDKYANEDIENKVNDFLIKSSNKLLINRKVYEVIIEINSKLITNENLTFMEEIIKVNCEFLIQGIYDEVRHNNNLKELENLKVNIEKSNKLSNNINMVLFLISTMIAITPYKDHIINFIKNLLG